MASCQQQSFVASGGLDQKIKLWDFKESRSSPISEFGRTSPTASIYSLVSTGDGTMLASASPERVVRLWDTRAGRQITSLAGHVDHVRVVLISSDGEWVLSGSSDTTVKLWSVRARRCLTTYSHHETSIWSLYSSHSRLKTFYSASKDGWIAKTVSVGGIDGVVGDMFDMTVSRSDHNVYDHSSIKPRPMSITSRQTLHHEAEGPILCMAIAKEETGVSRLAAADDGFIWTATKGSELHCWKDIEVTSDTITKLYLAHKRRNMVESGDNSSPESTQPATKAYQGNGNDLDRANDPNVLLDSLMSTCSLSQFAHTHSLAATKTFYTGSLPPFLITRHIPQHSRAQSYGPATPNRRRANSNGSVNGSPNTAVDKDGKHPGFSPYQLSMSSRTRATSQGTADLYYPQDSSVTSSHNSTNATATRNRINPDSFPIPSSKSSIKNFQQYRRNRLIPNDAANTELQALSNTVIPCKSEGGLPANNHKEDIPSEPLGHIYPLVSQATVVGQDTAINRAGLLPIREELKYIPVPIAKPMEPPHPARSVLTPHGVVSDEHEVEQSEIIKSIRTQPDWIMEGRPGILRHRLLHNKRHVLTQDATGRVALWDILGCKRIRTFDPNWCTDINAIEAQINTKESVPAWCVLDTKIGHLTVHLNQMTAWNAEVHVDELTILSPETIKAMGDHERINMGQWVLKRLFEPYVVSRLSRGPLTTTQAEKLANIVNPKLLSAASSQSRPSSSSNSKSESRRPSQNSAKPSLSSNDDGSLKAPPLRNSADAKEESNPDPKADNLLQKNQQRPRNRTISSSAGDDSNQPSPLPLYNTNNQPQRLVSPLTQTPQTPSSPTAIFFNDVEKININGESKKSVDNFSSPKALPVNSSEDLEPVPSATWLDKLKRLRSRKSKRGQKFKINSITGSISSATTVDTGDTIKKTNGSLYSTIGTKSPVSQLTESQKESSIPSTTATAVTPLTTAKPKSTENISNEAKSGDSTTQSTKTTVTASSRQLTDTERTIILLRQQLPDKKILYNPVFYPHCPMPPNISCSYS